MGKFTPSRLIHRPTVLLCCAYSQCYSREWKSYATGAIATISRCCHLLRESERLCSVGWSLILTRPLLLHTRSSQGELPTVHVPLYVRRHSQGRTLIVGYTYTEAYYNPSNVYTHTCMPYTHTGSCHVVEFLILSSETCSLSLAGLLSLV